MNRIAILLLTLATTAGAAFAQNKRPEKIVPVTPPVGFDKVQPGAQLIETNEFIRAPQAREKFQVTGVGFTAAVLDTGLRVTHVDFKGRVPAQANFVDGEDPKNAADGNGHGTNVSGIIAAGKLHTGIAPGAKIIPLKVLRADGGGHFAWMEKALDWVLANRETYNITVVNMSLGDSGNYQDDNFGPDGIQDRIRKLRKMNVAVSIAAGNDFFNHSSQQGMSYPGILRESVSVGAVYDANEGSFSYGSGAIAYSTGPGRITPFSQRLHAKTNKDTKTDIFAPGAPIASSGHLTDMGESIQHGTSQASPVTAGVILLLQEAYHKQTGKLPTVDQLETWLIRGGVKIIDGDDEDDNVKHDKSVYVRIDAYGALSALHRDLRNQRLFESPMQMFLKRVE